jgi:hypothetical protein
MQANKAFAKVIVVSMSGRISRTLQSAACAARFVAMDGKEVRIMDQKARAARLSQLQVGKLRGRAYARILRKWRATADEDGHFAVAL